MHTKNHMKSIISQASTVSKAIDEALKKAGMPCEFFVKLLEQAEGGFLGFGAKKAKIALFFKQEHHKPGAKQTQNQVHEYEQLFNNKSMSAQIEEELNVVFKSQDPKPAQAQRPFHHKKPHHKPSHQPRPTHTAPIAKNTPEQQRTKLDPQQPKPIQKHTVRSQIQPQTPSQPSKVSNPNSMRVRPLNIKKNDPSKPDTE